MGVILLIKRHEQISYLYERTMLVIRTFNNQEGIDIQMEPGFKQNPQF